MEAADSMEESTEDITAAATAPIPMKATKGGVRCRRMTGMTRPACPRSNGDGEPYEVRFQSDEHTGRGSESYTCLKERS